MAEKTVLRKQEADFNIVGKAVVNDFTFSLDQESKNNKNYTYSTMNLKVATGNGNEVFASAMGGFDAVKKYPIYVHGKDKDGRDDFKNQFQVDWDDRLDEDVIKTVGRQSLFTAGLEKDEEGKVVYKEFLSEYDFIAYVEQHLEKDMVVSVSGKLAFEPYQDNVNRKKNITKIILKDAKEEEFHATARLRVFVDGDSVGTLDEERQVLPLTVYVADYLYKHEGQEIKQTILFEQTIDLDAKKWGDKLDKIVKAYFTPKSEDGVVWLGVTLDIIEGAESTLSSVDDLPEDLAEQVELGLIDEKDAIAQCTTGNKERRLVFKGIQTKNMKDANDDDIRVSVRFYDEYTTDDYVFLGDVAGKTETGEDTISEDELDDLLDDLDLDI